MSRRIDRDADGVVRNKIPTIRQFDTDARVKGGVSTALYYNSTSAETLSFGKRWPRNMRSMTIVNMDDDVELLATIKIYSSALGADQVFLNKCKIRVGTSLVLTEDDLSIGSNEYFKLTTDAAVGTPRTQIIIRF